MRLGILLLFLIFTAMAQGQTPLQDMVKAEQAFSKMAEEKTTREAFMAFIADDGILFTPAAVNGKKWMLEHPVAPSDKKPLLAWQPSFAGMAASGDMGFTTGPSEFKADIKDAKPSWYGHFVTVWKKQPDGSWKWTVDIGINHPQSGGPITLWQPADNTAYTKTSNVEVESELKALLDLDRSVSSASLTGGFSKAFTALASPDVRLYRTGSLPFIGREASAAALATIKEQYKSEPIGGDVSRAGDLGYTHGTYELTGADQKVIKRGSYVRIWQKQDSKWRVVIDITNVH